MIFFVYGALMVRFQYYNNNKAFEEGKKKKAGKKTLSADHPNAAQNKDAKKNTFKL